LHFLQVGRIQCGLVRMIHEYAVNPNDGTF
jgi:hypothetical protein